MSEIPQNRLNLINDILKSIENMDEEEAEYFFKALARQSHQYDIDIFNAEVIDATQN